MEQFTPKSWIGSLTGIRLLAAVGAMFLAQTLWQWYRLAHIPGPFWAGFTRFWLLNQARHNRIPISTKLASEKYGESSS